jgi:hypothetical protein
MLPMKIPYWGCQGHTKYILEVPSILSTIRDIIRYILVLIFGILCNWVGPYVPHILGIPMSTHVFVNFFRVEIKNT